MALVNIGPMWVNPKHVSSIRLNPAQTRVIVKMHDGEHITVDQIHRETLTQTVDRLSALINESEKQQ